MLGGKLRQPGEMRPRSLRVLAERGHRHQAADADRRALDEGGELGRCDAALALLAGDIDLDQDLGVRGRVLAELSQHRLSGDRMDQPATGSSCLTLRLCRLPMKSHSKASAQRSCLAGAPAGGSRRPGELPPRPALPSPPVARTWSRRGSRPRARRSRRARSRLAAIFVRLEAVDQPGHRSAHLRLAPDQPGLAPSATGIAPVREEEVRLAAGTEPTVSTRSTPASSRRRRVTSGRSSMPPKRCHRPASRKHRAPLAHLVATGPDRRANRRSCGPNGRRPRGR